MIRLLERREPPQRRLLTRTRRSTVGTGRAHFQPQARVTYAAMYPDGIGRNQGGEMGTRGEMAEKLGRSSFQWNGNRDRFDNFRSGRTDMREGEPR